MPDLYVLSSYQASSICSHVQPTNCKVGSGQAKGLAAGQGTFLSADTEEADADELRMAVSDALCRSQERLKQFGEVVPSIEAVEGGLPKCAPSVLLWGREADSWVLWRSSASA